MKAKAKTTLLILIILLSALFWAVHPIKHQTAMKRESDRVSVVAQAEVRVILVGRGW